MNCNGWFWNKVFMSKALPIKFYFISGFFFLKQLHNVYTLQIECTFEMTLNCMANNTWPYKKWHVYLVERHSEKSWTVCSFLHTQLLVLSENVTESCHRLSFNDNRPMLLKSLHIYFLLLFTWCFISQWFQECLMCIFNIEVCFQNQFMVSHEGPLLHLLIRIFCWKKLLVNLFLLWKHE